MSVNSSADDTPAVVMDIGSELSRAGISGDDAPICAIPSILGCKRPQTEGSSSASYENFIGECVRHQRDELRLRHPIKHGIVVDWGDMEALIFHIYEKELLLRPTDQPVMLTEPIFNPKGQRETLTQLMFETFQVPHYYLESQSKLSLYSSGRTNGVILDSGGGVTTVTVSIEGYMPKASFKRVDIGGMDLTCFLARSLLERGYSFTTSSELDVVREFKEKHCFVAQDYDKEMASWNSRNKNSHTLPDGSVINTGCELFRCPEAMFNPPLIGVQAEGLHKQVSEALKSVDIDCRHFLLRNFVLAGGNTLLPGFSNRLRSELKDILPPKTKIHMVAAPERKYFAWIGGSIITSLRYMPAA